MKIPNSKDFHFNINWNRKEGLYFANTCTGQGHSVEQAEVSVLEAVEAHLLYQAELGLAMLEPDEVLEEIT